MKVIKRNGSSQDFDTRKIINAIKGANKETDRAHKINLDAIKKVAESVQRRCEDLNKNPSVEEIQDIVEEELYKVSPPVGTKYIRFRYKREMARNNSNDIMDIVREKLMATNVQHQNANVDENSFGGRGGETSSAIFKKYAIDFLLSNKAKENHLGNMIYIHDLDSYAKGMHNCLSVPLDELLANGFSVKQTDVRPAQSLSTAFQLVAVIFQLQSLQQFGGVSATHLDWTMVPYVRKSFYKHIEEGMHYMYEYDSRPVFNPEMSIDDPLYKSVGGKIYQYAMDKTTKELKQATEGMYHNLNTLQSRSGNQLPFTSINYGTCTSVEGRMVIRALLEGSLNGIGKHHRTPIFPCGIFQCMKGVNREPDSPNYDLFMLALKSTAQRLYPNYANVDWSNNAGYDRNDPKTYFSTMGCRTANGFDINGLGQQKDGRGNIAPVTIIMPELAMQCHKNKEPVEAFMKLLDTKIHEAREMLIERYDWICSQDPSSASFMYDNKTLAGYDGKTIESAMKHGTLVIGQLGLAETLQILIGCDHTEAKGMEVAKRIEQLFKDRCAEFKQSDHLNWGVYFSPAENLCYTAMEKFKEKWGVIPNVSDKDFFTNSMHVPVWKKISPFDKIKIESELTGYSNAGCITYIELDSGAKNNLKALEILVDYAMDLDVPYFAINVPNDTCLDCGYQDEFNDHCPQCNSHHIQQLRRVTGYLSEDYHNFNKGKQQEVEMRFKHSEELWNDQGELLDNLK